MTEHATVPTAVRIDPDARRAWLGDFELRLCNREYDLLALLVRNAGMVVTRDQIMRQVWDTDWWPDTRIINVTMGRLRAALGWAAARHITTVRGHGYRWDGPPPAGHQVDVDELAQFLRDTTPPPEEWAATAPLVPVGAWAAAILDHFEIRRRHPAGDPFDSYRPSIVDVPVAEGLL